MRFGHGRTFFRKTAGLSIGHVSPEAADGGAIGLVREGDSVDINIPERSISLQISDEEMIQRRQEEEACGDKAFTPNRKRTGSQVLAGLCPFCGLGGQGGGAYSVGAFRETPLRQRDNTKPCRGQVPVPALSELPG